MTSLVIQKLQYTPVINYHKLFHCSGAPTRAESPILIDYGQPLFIWLSRDWPSVRTYASTDCTGRVGETIKKKGGCLRRVLASPHLLYRTFTIWSIDSCQNRIATDQYPMTILRAHVSTHWGDQIYLEAVRWPVNYFNRSRSMFSLIISS